VRAECKNFLLRVNLADRFVSWNAINNSFEQGPGQKLVGASKFFAVQSDINIFLKANFRIHDAPDNFGAFRLATEEDSVNPGNGFRRKIHHEPPLGAHAT
jgi:hypothetical protein